VPPAAPARRLPTPPRPVRRLGRRVLGSPLVGALTAPHSVDRYLELIRPAWSLHEGRAEVVAARRQTLDSVTLALRPNENWKGFSAGQFVRLVVEIGGVRHTRCYSPACSAHVRDAIEITVKAHPEGRVSGFLNRSGGRGLVVGLSAADGDFVLPAERPEQLLLISGGSGITPVLSMVRTLCDEGYRGDVTFLHYAQTRERVPYRRELGEIADRRRNVRVSLNYTREPGGGLTGHLSRDHLLHIESFLPPSLALPSDQAEGSVSFARARAVVPNSGRSLLEQAEQAGLGPQFGCRRGICHTCTCRKTAGSVRNLLSGQVSSAEEEDIQICVSAPVGDVEIDL
jgi:stearoyl-CoA 9-desaturase NADPH oxidoreductase